MAKRYPRGAQFVRKAAYRWAAADTVEWFRERGVELKTEADGRMFPVTDSSQTIIDCLMKEVNRYGVEIRMHADVKEVTVEGPGFRVALADSRVVECRLCVYCMWRISQVGDVRLDPAAWAFHRGTGAVIVHLQYAGRSHYATDGYWQVPDVQLKVARSGLMEKGPGADHALGVERAGCPSAIGLGGAGAGGDGISLQHSGELAARAVRAAGAGAAAADPL